jgi:uncharacterized protein YbjT (DUF2867 family)
MTNRDDVLVVGGTGFLGRHLLPRLVARGAHVTVPSRRPERARDLLVLPTLRLVRASLDDPQTLASLMPSGGTLVHLVGVLTESRRPGGDFHAVHVDLTRRLLAAARNAGVRRYLHVSALGAGTERPPSRYLASKQEAENLVRASGLAWTIFRPAVVAGSDGGAALLFARLIRLFPLLPLASASSPLAPVAVEDVARALLAALDDRRTEGRIYELCGPEKTTLAGFVRAVAAALERRVCILPLPDALAQIQAALFERLPGRLLTRDQLRSLSVPGICSGEGLGALGITPTPLETALEGLGGHRLRRAADVRD